jgi:hypothetical protein
MRRFLFSRHCHVSASDLLFAPLINVDHHEGPAVEKSRRFPQFNRGTSLHCPPLRRVDASSSPLPYKCRALVHSSLISIP